MEIIVFQNLGSTISPKNYYNSIKIAYLLNFKIASIGIDDLFYYFPILKDNMSINTKLNYLINANDDSPEDYHMLMDIKKSFNLLAKIKHKSSKEVAVINKIKKGIEDAFEDFGNVYSGTMNKDYDLVRLKELLNEEVFYFYFNDDGTSSSSTVNMEVQIEALKLTINENEHSLLFLSNYETEEGEIDFDFLNPFDKKAEDKNSFYGEISYTFPLLDPLSSSELILTRRDLEQTTLEFRKKINEWVSICITNPNTNLGLEHFKKELQPFLKSTQNDILENPLLQNVSSLTHKKLESQIIIGEAPIEKIWKHYLDSKNISQDIFDTLLKIKTEQFPKFEGRWPIVYYKLTEDAIKDINAETENDGVKSIRKSISLD